MSQWLSGSTRSTTERCDSALELGIGIGKLREVRRQLTLGEVRRIQPEEPGSANRSAGNQAIELETPKSSLDRGQRDAKNTTELSPIAALEQPDRKEGSSSGLSTERA